MFLHFGNPLQPRKLPYTLLLTTIFPLPHFVQGLFSPSLICRLASAETFDGHSVFIQTSCGFLALLITVIIGCLHVSHALPVFLTSPFDGSLNVALHSGYVPHAMNLPNLPLFIISVPFPQAGHGPMVFSFVSDSFVASISSSPILFSFFLKTSRIFTSTVLASSSTSAPFFLSSCISSISISKCLVSSSSIISGLYLPSVSTIFIPKSVASMALPVT